MGWQGITWKNMSAFVLNKKRKSTDSTKLHPNLSASAKAKPWTLN